MFAPLAAFLLAYALIPLLSKMAVKLHLVDKPNNRKIHNNDIPLIGGIAVFVATLFLLVLIVPFHSYVYSNIYILFVISVLFLVGVIDDKYDLKASFKLLVQFVVSHIVFMKGVKIDSLQGFMGVYGISETSQYLLSIIILIGVINSFNLMDGIDGLAGGLAILGFALFTFMAFLLNQFFLALIFLIIIGALIAFIKFNFSTKNKVFLGDAGSLFIGFVIVISGISMIGFAKDTPFNYVVVLSIFSFLVVPVFDALRVFFIRIKAGKSPFAADKIHIQHLLLSTGNKHSVATFKILIIIVAILIVGISVFHIAGFTTSVLSMIAFFYTLTAILSINNNLLIWKNKILKLENNGHGSPDFK